MCLVFVLGFAGWLASVAAEAFYPRFDGFKTGEKLAYRISYKNVRNAGFAEMQVASTGLIGKISAVELRGKIVTFDFVRAVFYDIDRARTVFASTETGLPLYIKETTSSAGLPKETNKSFLETPSTGFDLLTLIHRARLAAGAGSFPLVENDKEFSVDFSPGGGEIVKVDAGEFETIAVNVSSGYFSELGIKSVRIWFGVEPSRIPVLFVVDTEKGEFRAELSSVSNTQPTPESTPTPTATPTPRPIITPTPTPYVENRPLSRELPFVLGEKLRYRVDRAGKDIATAEISAASRKQINGVDTLILGMRIENSAAEAMISKQDYLTAAVDPYSLVPFASEAKFAGAFSWLDQSVTFDQESAVAKAGTADAIEIPVGTHTPLSFLYAVRSFNLRPSKDSKNPVNDTRVSMFFGGEARIVTLRPLETARLEIDGRRYNAQQINIFTGDGTIDALRPTLWLAVDSKRTPLMLRLGEFNFSIIR
ncbi:MAG: DUF3108 domain-containing protein [Pyrinomonadaceae bacterium]